MQLMCGADGARLGAYGLGNVRTLAQFATFSGLDYANKVITEPNVGLV
jgi:hypothetical protein